MRVSDLAERDALRNKWIEVRVRRLALKNDLIAGGMEIHFIRRNNEYRTLVKEQHALSTRMKHLNASISRMNAKNAGEDNE